MARLTASFWVHAYLARLRLADIPAFVVAHGDDTAGARLVDDIDRYAKLVGHHLGRGAADQIGLAAGIVADEHGDRLGRVFVCKHGMGEARHAEGERKASSQNAASCRMCHSSFLPIELERNSGRPGRLSFLPLPAW